MHDFFADVIRDGQARGVIIADRDPVAEAWLFVAGGLLATMDNRLGGLLGDDSQRVRAERRRWMLSRVGLERRRSAEPPRREKAPAAAPGALPGQAGRRVGDPEFGSAAGRLLRTCRLWRSPMHSDLASAAVQGALTVRALSRPVK